MPPVQWLSELRDDLKSGYRQLLAAPGFSLLAIVTLALGIGANAAIFGVVKSVLLDALPYAASDQLVRIWGGIRTTPQIGPLTAATIAELDARQRSFASLAAFDSEPSEVVLDTGAGPRAVLRSWVEPRFFDTLGVVPAMGRVFRADEAGNALAPLSGSQLAPDDAAVIMVADDAWRRLLGSDPAIVGRVLRLDGIPRTVVGVLPAGFVGPMGPADFFFPMDLAPAAAHPVVGRGAGWLGGVARLRPGVTIEAARAEVAAIWDSFAKQYPDDNASLAIATVPLRDAMVGDTRRPLLVLVASAALVLLIACANLAAALLSRALARRKEFAVRAALGAGRRRVVRQLLTESVLLALCGGAAGLLLALGGLRLAGTMAAAVLPAYVNLALDGRAIAVTAAIAVATGLIFGVAPALIAGRHDPNAMLRAEGRGLSEGRGPRQLRGLLMAGQVALCLSLLIGAGLLARSLWAMTAAPLGLRTDGVLTALVQLPPAKYDTAEARARFHDTLVERARALPGVTAAASTTALPMTDIGQAGLTVEGVTPPESGQPFVLISVVSDDYFSTLQVPLRQGRLFDRRDTIESPEVAVISDSMARRYWPVGNAVGSRMRLGPDPEAPWIEVVGVVGDVRNDRTQAAAAPMAYLVSRQSPTPFVRILLRTDGDPLTLVRPLELALTQIDADLPLQRPATLEAVAGESLLSRRLPAALMMSFGLLALVLASVGIYAMFANMAAAREREFGIRLALGSRPGEIAALVVRQGAGWMIAGLLGGIAGAVVVIRLVERLLYGIEPFDPLTIAAAIAGLTACAALALLPPLRRAVRIDPAAVLRG